MENKIIEENNIIYSLNDDENTSFVIGHKRKAEEIYIPRSINHENKEYDVIGILSKAFESSEIKYIQFSNDSKLQTINQYAFSRSAIMSIRIPSSVTSIGEGAFCNCYQLEIIEIPNDSKLQTIEKNAFYRTLIQNIRIPSSVTLIGESAFCICEKLEIIEIPNDSKLQTIEKNAFFRSKIKNIRIPSDLIELKEGWCRGTSYLTKIEVSPNNQRYLNYEDKMIIGKTNIEENNYNCLIFCVRDIQHITIPNFIEHICSYSFNNCQQLEIIEIPNDSKLQTIDEYAFSYSRIKSIRIPSSVTTIGEGAFRNCFQLEMIEIPNDSKLQTIEKDAFFRSKIKNIRIPSDLIELKEGWCSFTLCLMEIEVSPKNQRYCCFDDKMIIGKTNIEENNYNCLIFCVRDIQHIIIPNFIEHICPYSFDHCEQLEMIEIPNDSKLQTIDEYAFYESDIRKIRISSSVTSIGEGAFFFCFQLEMIEIPNDSKLQKIEKNAFSETKIKNIKIPSSVTSIGEGAFYSCHKLEIVEIPNDSKLQKIEKNAFSETKIKNIKIPSSVTLIGESAFCICEKLEIIEIPNDSKLQTIEKNAFFRSKIKNIRIPSDLIEIKEGWCGETFYLTKIEVSPDNQRYLNYEDKMIIGKTNIEENNYNCLIFCVRDIQRITIPNFIEHICSYSFDNRLQLEMIEIPNDSKLQTIDKYAFSWSSLKSIIIPSSVTTIGEHAFNHCKQLEIIEIPNDSKLQTIDKYAFSNSSIKSIIIPSSVTTIEENAFYNCELLIIEINNAEQISMYQTAFENYQNTLLMIPIHS